MDKAKLLSGSSLFCQLTPSELETLAKHAHVRHFVAKQIIIEQGSRGDEMYAVVHGRLKVTRSNNDGREINLAILEGGEIFGELAMLDGAPRNASVEALEDGELLVLHRSAVDQYLAHHPHVMRSLITSLCERLRSANDLVQDTLFLPLPQRLAKVLRQLARNHGETNQDGVRIDLKMTQQDLANFVGASRESVNKQLSQWEDNGYLKMKSGYIQIIQITELPG
ncbi:MULTISPECIES: Crp/Fnr family transcriptional regulator [Deefgea]|uniref:Cyclic nucleotide-binding domain-containing protein n=1 Tax=Deefgea chitinilytica TaxID=570276 RepID=A0ABS2C8Y8_9NEIS|nr:MULTISPECIES: Crp/Fnr family transcriptional regulator [Deefgea]MBM5570616.1 cyclic nucleotide-binding domain-containing protein [Deefgea chitinilytica]MBM9887845.1 Crp/Fnr family transcriptional regulator [Deefgea sp. CFH1-16]